MDPVLSEEPDESYEAVPSQQEETAFHTRPGMDPLPEEDIQGEERYIAISEGSFSVNDMLVHCLNLCEKVHAQIGVLPCLVNHKVTSKPSKQARRHAVA